MAIVFPPLSERLQQAQALLAPFATPHVGRVRVHPEPEDATRFPFQRDRDRILHTQSFRRLMHKTQVFVAGHGDHYRTRMTHTLEVAQVSRDIARTLRLNEDLAESIALAHDLGHTPFGHAGEEALSSCLEPYGKYFEHNEQSLRIVTLLERRTDQIPGLNLCIDLLEGLQKHRTPHDGVGDQEHGLSLEGHVVNLADEIAYTAHDTDDGLRAHLFSDHDLRATALGRRAAEHADAQGTEVRASLVDVLVQNVYQETMRRLTAADPQSFHDVRHSVHEIVGFSVGCRAELEELRGFLWEHVYGSDSVQKQARRGQAVIRRLFRRYIKTPPPKVRALARLLDCSMEDAVKDYVAGMTDTFALSVV